MRGNNLKCVPLLVSLSAFAYRRTCEAFPEGAWITGRQSRSVCTDVAAVNVGLYNGIVPKLRQPAAEGDSLRDTEGFRLHHITLRGARSWSTKH